MCMPLTTDTQKGAPAPAAIHLLFTLFPYDGWENVFSTGGGGGGGEGDGVSCEQKVIMVQQGETNKGSFRRRNNFTANSAEDILDVLVFYIFNRMFCEVLWRLRSSGPVESGRFFLFKAKGERCHKGTQNGSYSQTLSVIWPKLDLACLSGKTFEL